MAANLAAGREALLQGLADEAAPIFAAVVEKTPSDHEARYWLSSALRLRGDPDLAEQTLNDARTLHALGLARGKGVDLARLKAEPAYANTVAKQFYGQGLVAMASVAWGLAISAGEMTPLILANYALALQHQGRVEEASTVYRLGVETFPSSAMQQFLVYAQLFCDDGERRHAAEARIWSERFGHAPAPAPHANPPLQGRRLRIGYVAPRFAGSQLKQFITPVLERHDPAKVEVVLYPADAATEAGWPAHVAVHPLGKLGDIEAAALIRADGIDILNDCWGHTAGSRLGVFARRPAPVQAAWINFFQTTGLTQIDYVLHAASATPPDFADLFVEEIWPLAPVFTPFRPAAGRLPPAATPALTSDVITFGSFNHPAKLSASAVGAWAAVLRCRPASRLLLKYRYYDDPVMQRSVQSLFGSHGVAPERLTFAGHSAGEDYYRAFQTVDLMLDCWPAPGSTTTLEALSNGVPVLAMVGDEPSVGGHYAGTILDAVGLAELVTTSPQAFVDRALELTEDIEALDRLRERVRPGFDASPFCDEAGFTRRLEEAYAEMFERWSASAGKPPRAAAAAAVR